MAEGIKDKVAVIGMGCVKFGENWDKSLEDMIVDAAYEAFEDAGIGPESEAKRERADPIPVPPSPCLFPLHGRLTAGPPSGPAAGQAFTTCRSS